MAAKRTAFFAILATFLHLVAGQAIAVVATSSLPVTIAAGSTQVVTAGGSTQVVTDNNTNATGNVAAAFGSSGAPCCSPVGQDQGSKH